MNLTKSLSGSRHAALGAVFFVLRGDNENFVAPNVQLELRERPLRRTLERSAGPRVEPAIVAGTLDLSFFRLVENRAGEMRAFLLEGTPFIIAQIYEDVRHRAARKGKGVGAADRHVLSSADEMLSVIGWCGKSLSRTATHALPAASPPETKTRYLANSRRKTC